MDTGYLMLSLLLLALGVVCVLSPGMLNWMSGVLDRSVGLVSNSLLKHRAFRYLLGLFLFAASFGLFRLAYLSPMFRG